MAETMCSQYHNILRKMFLHTSVVHEITIGYCSRSYAAQFFTAANKR